MEHISVNRLLVTADGLSTAADGPTPVAEFTNFDGFTVITCQL